MNNITDTSQAIANSKKTVMMIGDQGILRFNLLITDLLLLASHKPHVLHKPANTRVGTYKKSQGGVVILCIELFSGTVNKNPGTIHIILNVHDLVSSCRPGGKVSDVLKMVDVPVCQADLLFDVIEGAVCPLIFTSVHVKDDVAGELLDASDVVCDGHDILLYIVTLKK